METMHAAGRRSLPPVPRPALPRPVDRAPAGAGQAGDDADTGRDEAPDTCEDEALADTDQDETLVIDTDQIVAALIAAELAELDRVAPEGTVLADAGSRAGTTTATAEGSAPADPAGSDHRSPAQVTDATEQLDLSAIAEYAEATDQPTAEGTVAEHPVADEPVCEEPVAEQPVAEQAVADEPAALDAPADEPAVADEPAADEPAVADEPSASADPAAEAAEPAAEPAVEPMDADDPTLAADADADAELDPAQLFVARLRSCAPDFATAAGARRALVREAVPPARHRRARCRLVLRFDDGRVEDVTLIGPAGTPGPSRHGFDRQILRWLDDGQVRDARWLVEDADAADGVAVDLAAWNPAR